MLKFIKLRKLEIRKAHYIINLSSSNFKQFKSYGFSTICSRTDYVFLR